MDLTSVKEELSTDVEEGLVNLHCYFVHTASGQEPKVPSSVSEQISLEDGNNLYKTSRG